MNLIIHPYVGIGSIRFGMTITEVRQTVARPVETFIKDPEDPFPTDYFPDLGLYIEYKYPGICQSVEMAKPANPIWRGQHFLDLSFTQARTWFESIDPSIEVDDSGLTSYQFGIGLYAPFASDDPEEIIEGVLVFEQGYYD